MGTLKQWFSLKNWSPTTKLFFLAFKKNHFSDPFWSNDASKCCTWLESCGYVEVSRNANNSETNAKKLITRPIMTVTSPNSPHIALTYTKIRFDNFFDHSYPPSWSKLPKCIESGVFFLSGQKSNQNSRISTAKFY